MEPRQDIRKSSPAAPGGMPWKVVSKLPLQEGRKLIEKIASPLEIKEKLFSDSVINRVLETFFESLEENAYTQEQVDEIKKELERYSEEDIKGALAIPREIREKYLQKLKDKTPKEMVATLVQNARTYGYTLGYHISPRDIKEDHIDGTEADYRDNDLMRAYYSTEYKNLYLKKGGDYLYIVRAETGKNSSHRQDNDGSWGRASSLAIVDKLPLREIREEVEALAKTLSVQKEKTG